MFTAIIFFIVGFLGDILWTKYLIYVNSKNIPFSGIFAFAVVIYNTAVIEQLIINTDFILHLIFFALGQAAGTMFAIWKTKK